MIATGLLAPSKAKSSTPPATSPPLAMRAMLWAAPKKVPLWAPAVAVSIDTS